MAKGDREDQERVINHILAQLRSGAFSAANVGAIYDYIEKELGYTQEGQAANFYQTLVIPRFVTSASPTGVGAPTVPAIGNVTAPTGVSQEDLLAEQRARPQFLQGVLGATGRSLGGFTPLAQSALETSFRRFAGQDPLLRNAGLDASVERGKRFQDFLTTPKHSGEQLGQLLVNQLGEINTGGAAGQASFSRRYPTANAALLGAIQPYLSNVAPREREATASMLMNMFEPEIASNPQNYQTPQQLAGIIQTILDNRLVPGQGAAR